MTDDTNTNASESVRARVVVTGRVQGVCFRWETRAKAARLGVAGWVRNRSAGTVEGVFEGTRPAVEALIQWCHHGPPGASVREVATEWETAAGEFDGFEIAR